MSGTRRRYGVWLGPHYVGALNQRDDYTWFSADPGYLAEPDRPVLGLVFEENPGARHSSSLRLPPWFSNLLPEGILREWIAADRHVSPDREMELLAQVGHDLPGAVQVVAEGGVPEPPGSAELDGDPYRATGLAVDGDKFGFSLAGVALKFSVVRDGDRLTLPAHGMGGDWITKLPDPVHEDLPRNEHAMMRLAAASGIDVPEVMLVHRSRIADLPPHAWKSAEEWAYAVRRFDRDERRAPVHIEDLAQVRNVFPDQKYQGRFETVAALVHRRRDVDGLREFARRMAFNVLIANGDAHLKNWSLIYRDPHVPSLAPAYDLVSTAHYAGEDEDLGLRFGRSRRFDRVNLGTFDRLQRQLGAPHADLPAVVSATVERVRELWPEHAGLLDGNPALQDSVDRSIAERAMSLLRKAT